jgi:hypothetical protein
MAGLVPAISISGTFFSLRPDKFGDDGFGLSSLLKTAAQEAACRLTAIWHRP